MQKMNDGFLLIVLLLAIGILLPLLIFLGRNLRNILPYLYMTARIRAKEARLLKPETMDDMINSGSIAEIASILENSEYAFAMQGLVLDSSESIEALLVRQTAEIYSEVVHMLPKKAKNQFIFLQLQWDVKNIKTVLRGVRKSVSPDTILSKLIPFGELDPELLRKMAESPTVEDILPLFENTRYEPLTQMLGAYEQDKNLVVLEALLDKIHLEEMWKAITLDRELLLLKPTFSARIDALNLKLVFRAKRDHLLLGDIEKYLISGGELPESIKTGFEELDDIAELVSELEGTVFHKPLMDSLQEYQQTGKLIVLEKAIDETALLISKETAVKVPYGIAPLLGFLSLKETEIRNIRAISRSKECGLLPEDIKQLVLRV